MELILLAGLVVFSVIAVFLRDLLKSAICLAAASIFLSMIFFKMSAPYAAVFELSVVAGLITVLFIVTISFTRNQGETKETSLPLIIFPALFVIFAVLSALLIIKLSGNFPSKALMQANDSFGNVFWGTRAFDIIGQMGIIFAAVFTVITLLREKKK